jgi:protein TonB
VSLDVAPSSHTAQRADDPVPIGDPPPQRALLVLPLPSGGYGQRSRVGDHAFAFAVTLALHVAALVAFLNYRSAAVVVVPPPPPLVVTLLPLAPPAAQKRTTQVKPKPAPHKPALPAARPIQQPPPRPFLHPPVEMSEDPLPAPVSPPAPPAPAVTAPAPARDPPGTGRDSWEGRVLARLERFKRYPSAARSRRRQGVTTIRFRLDRRGQVLSSSIENGSGNPDLDREALAMLARAQPLPPIPPDRPDEIELVVPVEFFLHGGG